MGGRIPAALVAGGEGEVGEQLEEVESYVVVGRIGVGDGRTRPTRGEQGRATQGGGARRVPARLGERRHAVELHWG